MSKTAHRAILALALGVAVFSIPAEATTVRIANLESLIDNSNRIFVGKCLSEDTGDHNGLPYTEYAFQVIDGVKGVVTDEIVTLRQFGLATPIQVGNDVQRVLRIPGMPRYTVGSKVMLFVVPDSPIGLSSPVGLSQGAFSVMEKDDREVMVNGVDNMNLYRGLSPAWMQAHGVPQHKVDQFRRDKGGDLEYNDFVSTVRRAVEVSR